MSDQKIEETTTKAPSEDTLTTKRNSGDQSNKASKIEVDKTSKLEIINNEHLSLSKVKSGQKKSILSKGSLLKHNRNITLTEDCFGILYDTNGVPQKIKRFTWKNHNNIEAQVITYGARVLSIKLPDRKGVVDDVVLGFSDLAGYLYYDLFFGATIGRFTNTVENSTFVIDGKQYWLSSNNEQHHSNGGAKGFDKVIWQSYVNENKVILSHSAPGGEEGYPGDLFVRITFELTTKNEFSIDMEATTSAPTIINLSNLIYFNLAGHQKGPEELYRHTVTINANCYTLNSENDGFPTGEISNVVHTQYDFQVPKILKTCLGVEPNDGFDQNFCVNRGVDQGNCFVARALHVPSGRILEVYSNQCGVNFNTANNFGSGFFKVIDSSSRESSIQSLGDENIFVLLDLIHEKMVSGSEVDEEKNFVELKDLVRRIKKCKYRDESCVKSATFRLNPDGAMDVVSPDFELTSMLKPLELKYLDHIKNLASTVHTNTTCFELKTVVENILKACTSFDKLHSTSTVQTIETEDIVVEKEPEVNENIAILENLLKDKDEEARLEEERMKKEEEERIAEENRKLEQERKRKDMCKPVNKIPLRYKDGRIHGKNCAIYKRHGAIAFQTQNYPNAIYHENFPNCIVRPGETYRHTIVYKFWIQSGKPAMWIKRTR